MKDALKKAFYATFVLELLFGMYLLIFDTLLQSLGALHWTILLVYLAIIGVLVMGYYKQERRMYLLIAGTISLLAFIFMLADAAFGLPLSQAHSVSPGFGWAYLFGFGTNAISSFSTSFAFTGLFVFVLLNAAIAFMLYRNSR
ncbi:hypothetical protein M1439_02755 [Candidatus Marsarchaeota archaeon]|jgi:hypothetical protein|nr:hypothetical protein [Candidatus Marsarchaeota archaeon]